MNDRPSSAPDHAPPELTPRQQQILKLLQQGKVNKEVARELDIGLGTVKQHIVAIFRKLKVTNRTAAATRNLDLKQQSAALTPPVQTASRLNGAALTRRPCLVLSMALSKEADAATTANFYGALASAAAMHDAIFLTRQGNSGEIIFGVQQATEYDVAAAIQAAYGVYQSVLRLAPNVHTQMHGCLTAGLAMASMHRYGGWTGEVIASAAIASARTLLESTPWGKVTCDQAVLELCQAFGVSGFSGLSDGVSFDVLAGMQWHGVRQHHPLVGRQAELSQILTALNQAFAGQPVWLMLEGEMGMGKTHLCQELLQVCQSRGAQIRHFRGLPASLGAGLCDVAQGSNCLASDVVSALKNRSINAARLILLDDFHLLAQAEQLALTEVASHSLLPGRMLVFAGRKGLCQQAPPACLCIFLGRLPASDMQTLIGSKLSMQPGKRRTEMVNHILDTSLGVPLFAVEMTRTPHLSELALSLWVAVQARLDKLHLDSVLLSCVARQPAAVTVAELTALYPDDLTTLKKQLDRALASGVFVSDSNGRFSFAHPMIRCALNKGVMEPYASI
ncbi:MAG: LuxR C-terminal-related transcriptional regulator [Rhodoferax sp.]|nr:LuxR C-terminal-related transcriptional regulator [Rhodoferax sp.]